MRVTTQTELVKAVAAGDTNITIDSPAGVWLTVTDSSRVVARGSSRVEARGSSRVVARDSSHVEAWDSSHVEARGSSHVEAWGSSHVVARDSSHVEAWDSSHVVARDSSHVEARDSSHVVAWGSSRVEARDSSRVEARGSSRVEAWDSSRVVARGSSHVEASKYVAVHLHSKRVTLTGGVVIDVTDIDTHRVPDFIDYHGVKVVNGTATVYKAVDGNLNAGQHHTLTNYAVGATVTAPDWKPSQACGNGLHFGYRPSVAGGYYNGVGDPVYLECEIQVAGMIALGDKVKAESCQVVRVVDIHGDAVTS